MDNYFMEFQDLNSKTTEIYYGKRDNTIALDILIAMIPATKENNMQYKEGDYLRYIKVKDNARK